MGIYAEITSGTVTNVAVAMAAPSGGEWVEIDTLSPMPGIGWTYSGSAFAAPAAPGMTLAQQAAAAGIAGLTIALSGSLTLAATLFPSDAVTQQKLAHIAATIGATGGFPGGLAALPMKDASGAWHSFDLAQWKAVAGAIAAYVAACDLIADGNPLAATALPASSVALSV